MDIPLVIDISISRSNSVLFMRDNRIYIHDAGSKHGTYIRTQKPIMVKNDVPKYFLYKNHLVSAAIN